jgi:hypothetical protein
MFMNPDLATQLARQQQRQMLAQAGHHQRRRRGGIASRIIGGLPAATASAIVPDPGSPRDTGGIARSAVPGLTRIAGVRHSSSFLQEGIMHRTSARTGVRAACFLAALAIVLAATAIPAFARPAPPLNAGFTSTSAPAVVYTIVADGMPGWQITVIAVGAAVTAAILAVFLDRARAARRRAAASRRTAVPAR